MGRCNALWQVARSRINCSLCRASMEPGFSGAFILVGNFIQSIIKVPRISGRFCRPCQARSPSRETARTAARAPICACSPSFLLHCPISVLVFRTPTSQPAPCQIMLSPPSPALSFASLSHPCSPIPSPFHVLPLSAPHMDRMGLKTAGETSFLEAPIFLWRGENEALGGRRESRKACFSNEPTTLAVAAPAVLGLQLSCPGAAVGPDVAWPHDRH